MVEKATVAILWAIPVIYGLIAIWKVVGVLLGERLLQRYRAGEIDLEDATDENRALRRRYGRFNFNGVLALLLVTSWISNLLGDRLGKRDLLATAADFISKEHITWFGNAYAGLCCLYILVIPLVEILDRRQVRALPDPEDPVAPRLPAFRDSAGFVWWILVAITPLAVGALPGKALAGYFLACFVGAVVTLPLISYRKRRARFFQLSPDSIESSLIGQLSRETRVPIRSVEVEADDRCYAYVDPVGNVVMSHRFAEAYNAAEKKALLSYEMIRGRLQRRSYLIFLPILFVLTIVSIKMGPVGAIAVIFLYILAVLVALPQIELAATRRGQAFVNGLGKVETALLESYLSRRPAPGWSPFKG